MLALLLIVGSPFLRLEQGVPDADGLPAGHRQPRRVCRAPDRVPPRRDDADRDPADTTGAPTSAPSRSRRSTAYRRRVAALDGIDRVEGPFSITDPATGAPMTPAQVARLRRAGRLAAARRSRPCRAPARRLRPRQHRPARRDQPAKSSEPAGTERDPARPRGRAGRAHHDVQVGGAAAPATTSCSARRSGSRRPSA